jgi:L-iditol 2-dehydrogenase
MQIEMKAGVLRGKENLKIEDIDIPSCNRADILIKVESCAICKTDVKMFHAGHRDLKLPRVLGHEVAGTIVEVGKEIDEVMEDSLNICSFQQMEFKMDA